MLQTSFFEQPLAASRRGVAYDRDPRALQAAQLAERGEYLEAAELAWALIEDGSHDIRVICYYLCGVFMEGGARSLASIAPRLLRLLIDELDQLTPENKRERVIDSALSWLFRVLAQQCLFQAAQKDDIWRAWMAAMDSASVADIAHSFASLQGVLAELIETSQSQAQLARLQRWLKDSVIPLVTRRERAQAQRAAEAAAAAEPADAGDAAMIEPSEPDDAFAAANAAVAASEAARPVAGEEGSPALVLLTRKLQAFERLMEQGAMVKAAVVAADIREIIANFDPLMYLPNLFSNYVQLLSGSIEEIMPYWEEAGSPTWQALEQFYRTDLERFVGK